MTIKFILSKRTLFPVSLLAAFILMGSAVTRAQETYSGSAGPTTRDITAVITWQKDFVTTPDENNPRQSATNLCWPFSIAVTSPREANPYFAAAAVVPRYKLKGDMHVCTFTVAAPVGVPLVIEPSVRGVSWLNAKPVPPPAMLIGRRFLSRRDFTPYSKHWTLGAKGVYLSFTYDFVLYTLK